MSLQLQLQFGGIVGTSTTDDLVEMTHIWYEATDTFNTCVHVVMLDFSKAFDLINYHILADNKLTTSGLPVHIVRWIGAFLLDRRQKVIIGNNCSSSGSPNGGVPQGTLSGPKCLLLYINDLESHVPLHKYVDDSTLFEICFTPDDNVRNSIPSIVIDGNLVETVEYAKLLGVTLSNDLTWNRHVECIVKKKAAKRVYMLYQLKRAGISQLYLVTVHISVERPVLEYTCPVRYTNLPKYLSDSIE